MNLENDKKESSIKEIKNDFKKTSNNKYISLENNNNFISKKYKKPHNVKFIPNKKPSRNVRPCSTLNSNINYSNTNFNTLNKSIIITNPNLYSYNQNDNKNKFKDSRYTFEELNRKFHTLKIEQRRREKSLVFYRNKSISKNKLNTKKFTNNIRRAISFSNLSSNLKNFMDKKYEDNLETIAYNTFYNKNHNTNYNKFLGKKSNKIDFLKLKINSMIDDFDKDEIKNKKPLISSYKNNTNYNLFYNCSKSKSKDLNFLNTKENDMNKYNIFAKSKLMDINDIKKINNNNSFYDINYNRGYNKIFNKRI